MSEKPQQNVSRETQRDQVTPEQVMLNEIIDRAMSKSLVQPKEEPSLQSPAEPGDVSRETYQGELRADKDPAGHSESCSLVPPPIEPKDSSSETPSEKSSHPHKNKPSSAYIYLAVLFGAAFLMLLLAYFVQQRNNATAMDDLRMTSNASKEELLEKIKQLEAENQNLQNDKAYLDLRLEQIEEERENFRSSYESANNRATDELIHRYTLEYFWYIDQFMKNKDYPMAAAAVLFQADSLHETWNTQVAINPVQIEQYEAYRQELINRGYLQELDDSPENNGYRIWFTDQWSPSERDDVAALYNLWCALSQHFVLENDNAAAQYLYYYPLGQPETGYRDYVARLASDFTLEQFQIMKDELMEDWFITVLADGSIIKNYSASQTDERYVLPFQLPETWNWRYIVLN